MNKVKFATAIATSALLLGALAPASFAATNNVTVSGNGAFSGTHVTVKNVSGTTVSQSNNTTVTNVVTSKANSGKNTSSFNTGGTSTVVSGPATSNVNVTTGGSSNTANVTSNCNCNTTTNVDVSDNGAFSHNGVKVTNKTWLTVLQSNVTSVLNSVASVVNSGKNDSSFNTGGGSVVGTDAATSNTTVTVGGSTNTLNQ